MFEASKPPHSLTVRAPKRAISVRTAAVHTYLIRDSLVFKGLEELALLERGEQALLVAELEKHVAPVANERRPVQVFQQG